MAILSAYYLLPAALSLPFVTPSFFFIGLLLVAVPIIIHILNRRRFKTVTWAAMEYLLRAMKKNRRRLKFEQMILLATRCLVLALLGAALARPLACDNRAMSALGGQTGLTVFVIDNSYSMAYTTARPDAPTHLAQAKRIAKALIDRLSAGGESVAVITTTRPPHAALGAGADDALIVRPGFDLEAAKSAIDRIDQSYLATDLPGALQLAMRIATEDTRQARRKLCLITDATRGAFEGPQAQALQQLGQDLAKQFEITHYNLTEGRQQTNLAALDLRPDAQLVTTQFGAALAARVSGYGSVPEVALRWTLNDGPLPNTPAARYDVDTAPAVQSAAKFTVGGPQVLTVSVMGSDSLRDDDTRQRVVDVSSDLKVLIVEGERGSNALDGSGAFLQIALAPPREAAPGAKTSSSYVSTELISDLEWGNKPLDDYSAVILAGVPNVLPAQADALRAFVRRGGTAMVFMGEPVSGENYNAILLPRNLLPGPLVKRMSSGQNEEGFYFEYPPRGLVHPLLRLFSGQEDTGLDKAKVFTYWQADVQAGSNVERVLNYLPRGTSNAATRPGTPDALPDPAITVHSLGLGRVVFMSTTGNSQWTTLPAKPNYVTLIHELLQGSVRTGDSWLNLDVGQSIEIPPTVRLIGAPSLLDPAKKPLPIEPAVNTDGLPIYRSQPLTRPGVYTLATGNRVYPIAVNIPAGEADVRTIGGEGVKKALGGIDIKLSGDELPAPSVSVDSDNDLSWIFMVILFALLLAECFMAMRFGHYRKMEIRTVPQPV